MVQDLEQDNLKEIVDSNKQVIVQYGATWCGNCRLTKPKFKKLSNEFEAIKFVYVDAEKLPNSRGLAQVDNLPTFAGFKDGELVYQIAGNKGEIIKEVIDAITAN